MPVELRGVVFKGLYETHIDVVDLDRSVGFYEDVLQLELGVKLAVDAARADSHSRGARRAAIMWIGGQGHAALGLWERPAGRINVQHFALELEWHLCTQHKHENRPHRVDGECMRAYTHLCIGFAHSEFFGDFLDGSIGSTTKRDFRFA